VKNNEPEDTPNPEDFVDASPNPGDDPDLAVLCDALQEQGITRVVVRYEGSGGSGGIEEIEYEPPNAQPATPFEDLLRDLAENYCPAGYENNEGGYGTLTIHPFLGLAELEHSQRYQDTEDMGIGTRSLPEPLQQRLAQLGVTDITAHFNGYGDSGEMEDLTVEPSNVQIEDGLREELENFLLEQLPGGWEINEGSFGDFVIDVSEGQVALDASWRTEQSEDSVTRWKWRK